MNMLLLLAWWAALLLATLPVGGVLARACDHELPAGDRFCIHAFLGLFGLSAALLVISFFTPLSPATGGAVLVLGMSLWAMPTLRKQLVISRSELTTLAAILAASAWNASGPVMLYDMGLYHYPLLRWLAEAGTVPGMGLLHFRLGFSSSWLATAAITDWGPWQGNTAGVMGGLLMALLVYQFTICLGQLSSGGRSLADQFWCAACPLFFIFMIVQRQQASPSPNLAIAGGVLVTGWLLARTKPERNLAVIMAALALTLKLQAAPAVAVAMIARFAVGRGWWKSALAAVALSVPLLLANFISTGCPLFPSSLACLETPASIGSRTASYFMRDTLYWARYYGTWDYNKTFFSLDWLPRWFSNPWNWVFAGTIIVGLWGAWKTRASLGWAGAVGIAGTAYVMLSAPDLRFAIGYSAILCGLVGVGWSGWTRCVTWVPSGWWTSAAVGVLLLDAVGHEASYYYLLHAEQAAFRWERVIGASPIPDSTSAFTEKELNGVRYRTKVPDGASEQCWGTKRPCTPYELEETVHYCDPSQGERGGYCRKLP